MPGQRVEWSVPSLTERPRRASMSGMTSRANRGPYRKNLEHSLTEPARGRGSFHHIKQRGRRT